MPSATNDSTDHLTQSVTGDFFQGDIKKGLERMRRRLLDLTNRNRLLNYKETKSSTLRVIDEVPDVLYEKLVEGKELCFRPVPKPRRSLLDGEEPETTKVKVAAENLGLNTSFELSIRDKDDPNADKRHVDNEIQTLHFPDRLETLLGKIGSSARLAIEETGTNMLYLVFGFLEWYDRDDSKTPHLAPLLLLPVSLRRGDPDPNTRTFRYYLSYSGEDILANISLEEKMKADFKLELPSLEEEDTPESYLKKFAPILKAKEGWKVHRFVTLTLLSFGKLLMYRDLDPDNWPKGKKISDHERIKEFFEGIQSDGIQIAKDYNLDEPDQKFVVPQLIDNADSSQHSAIIDALAGKNLVIQGPPGTGKSQTITNLIAAALVSGKSVLFVSEKLAALEVVRRRLDKAGLGMFCLELHSNKTKKDGLLKDVASRIELRGTFSSPRSLNDKLMQLHEQKMQLRSYAKVMGANFGNTQMSVYDIFWRRERLRSEYGSDDGVLADLRVPEASTITRTKIDKGRELAENYVLHMKSSHREGRFSIDQFLDHPWRGVENSELSLAGQADLRKFVKESVELATDIETLCESFDQEVFGGVGNSIFDDRKTIRGLSMFIAELSKVLSDGLNDIEPGALPHLRSEGMKEHIQGFFQQVGDFRQVEDELTQTIGRPISLSEDQITGAREAAAQISSILATPVTLGGAAELPSLLRVKVNELANAAAVFGEVCTDLALRLPQTLGGYADLLSVLDAIETCPLELVESRHPGFLSADALETIDRATREAAPILEDESHLRQVFDLSLVPNAPELAGHIAACANAGFFRFLDSGYRTARGAFRAAALDSGKPSRDKVLTEFRGLLKFQNSKQEFASNSRYASLFGEGFDGIYTPFDKGRRLVVWLNRVRELMAHSSRGPELTQQVWELSGAKLRLYSGEKLASMRACLARAHPVCSEAESLLSACSGVNEASDPNRVKRLIAEAETAIEAATRFVLSLQIPGSISVADIDGVLSKVERLQSLSEQINGDKRVAGCFAETYDGVATNTQRIANTTRTFLNIEESSLPEGLKDYFLSPAVHERFVESERFVGTLAQHVKDLQRTLNKLAEIGQIPDGRWRGSDTSEPDSMTGIIAKGKRGLSSEADLNAYVQYLQARERFRSEASAGALIEGVEGGSIDVDKVAIAYEFSVFNSVVKDIFAKFPEVAKFSGLSQSQVRERFRKLDTQCIELYRKSAANVIDQRPVPPGIGKGLVRDYSEASLLVHEISKQKRHIPIRQLIHRAGNALQALKPCFMMGPLSVAQYLAPGNFAFDFVVMDEASQLKPEDALGAVARGSQIVVVGDRRQLPPTSFFDRLDETEDEDDDNLAQNLADSESILDVANSVYQPARMLRWHYRSRHASLIAFSNREFYEGNLIVFPSPVAKSERLGVRLKMVDGGAFVNRRNQAEAEELIKSVISQISAEPDRSLGVVAMNIAQKDLLEELFLKKLKECPEIEEYLEVWRERSEPFFIKNLENVQGDERDVIFVSMTYGPNEQGRLLQRFGPINSATGHRRLNVLFTRSRCRIDVFSSMTADKIVVGPESSAGVKALRGYLEYARTGVLETAQFSGREPDSDFEIEVASVIKELGFDSVAQVGVAGFFLDMAVCHPTIPNTFLLGVECDGAAYHSSSSARDRDRIREDVLNDLGWKLHRIWSVDWYHDRDRQIKMLGEAITKALKAPRPNIAWPDPIESLEE